MKIKKFTSLKLLLCLIGFSAYSQPMNPYAYYTFEGSASPINEITPATLTFPNITSAGCTFCKIKLNPNGTNHVSAHNTGQFNTQYYQSIAANSQPSTIINWGTSLLDATASDAITIEMLVRFDKSATLQTGILFKAPADVLIASSVTETLSLFGITMA